MLKKLSFGDKTGLCITAYRDLEDMQLLTKQGITTIKGFKVIEIEEVKDIAIELQELLNDEPFDTNNNGTDTNDTSGKEEIDYDRLIKIFMEDDFIIPEEPERDPQEEHKKQIGIYCIDCCGTCSYCPYIEEDDYSYFLKER